MARLKTWRALSILLVLAVALSLGIVALPMAGTVEASPGELYVDDDAEEAWYKDLTHFKMITDAIDSLTRRR